MLETRTLNTKPPVSVRLEIREDGFNLNRAYRRCPAKQCDSIGEWTKALKFITILSVVTNATMITFVGSQLANQNINKVRPVFDRMFLPGYLVSLYIDQILEMRLDRHFCVVHAVADMLRSVCLTYFVFATQDKRQLLIRQDGTIWGGEYTVCPPSLGYITLTLLKNPGVFSSSIFTILGLYMQNVRRNELISWCVSRPQSKLRGF